jgi:hypothetical protein
MDAELKPLSTLSPKDIVSAGEKEQPFLSKPILKRFLGLRIRASGRVDYMDTVGGTYVTVGFKDHGVHVSANFDKPTTPEVEVLRKGDTVVITGSVFNATKDIVVLDHSNLIAKNVSSVIATDGARHAISRLWHETGWGKVLISVVAGLILAGILAIIHHFM